MRVESKWESAAAEPDNVSQQNRAPTPKCPTIAGRTSGAGCGVLHEKPQAER